MPCLTVPINGEGLQWGGTRKKPGCWEEGWGVMLNKPWRKRKRFRELAPQCPSWMDNLSLSLCLTSFCLLSKEEAGDKDTFPPDSRHPQSWKLSLWCPALLRCLGLVHMDHHSPSQRRAISVGTGGLCEQKACLSGWHCRLLLSPPSTPRQYWSAGDSNLRLVLGLNVVLNEGENTHLSFIR